MQLKWCLTLLATVLLAGSSANASIVIDSFSFDNTQDINSPGSTAPFSTGVFGTRTITLTGSGGFQSLGPGEILSAVGPGSTLLFDYSLAAPIDLHSSGNFAGSPLVLDLFDTVNGTFSLQVTYHSGADSATLPAIAFSNASPTAIGIQGTSFGDGALASAVDRIELLFTGTGFLGGSFQTPVNGASIAAVPEPTTMALLTPLMLGGVFYRRRKAKEADQSKI